MIEIFSKIEKLTVKSSSNKVFMLNIPDETAIISPQVIGLDKIDKSFNVADIPRRSVRPDETVVYAAPTEIIQVLERRKRD